MTVEEMRALMRRRVVPENLVVQNIVEYLMDEAAQLPQLNAFLFLNRLQQLGIASADFVALLEGCNAPQPLVDRIKANPAMSLNSLVLTLENSGLTSEDYSRILYTARLVWEQTQTSGGTVVPYPEKNGYGRSVPEKSEAELFDDEDDPVMAPEGEPYGNVGEELAEEPRDNYDNNSDPDLNENADENSGKDSDNNLGEDSDGEPTFDEIMRHIRRVNPGAIGEKPAEEIAVEETGDEENAVEENAEDGAEEIGDDRITDEEIADEKNAEEKTVDEENEPDAEESAEEEAINWEAARDKIREEAETEYGAVEAEQDDRDKQNEELAEPVNRSFEDTSTLIVAIDPEQIKKNITGDSGDLAEKADSETVEKADPEDHEEPVREENPAYRTGSLGVLREKSISELSEDSDYNNDGGSDGETDIESDGGSENNDGEDYFDEYDEAENREKLRASGYHKTSLMLAAAGAAVLFLISAYFSLFVRTDGTVRNLVYAKNANEIFDEIYSYTSGTVGGNIGGENANKYVRGEKLFGTMLVAPLSKKDFGMFSDGTIVYSASEDKITAYSGLDVNRAENAELLPPANTRFVEVWESESAIVAVFSGTECGFMRVEKGEVVFTVRQDGELCDFAVEEGEISFGSVYVPRYTHSFKAADTSEYLPRLGKNEKTELSAENIVLGYASGCSYAVWGKYSLSDGSVLVSRAAIGDPVYAGAYGVCAMNYSDSSGEHGRIIDLSADRSAEQEEQESSEPSFIRTEKITAAANGKNAFAALIGGSIMIFDGNISNGNGGVFEDPEYLDKAPSGMRFDGDRLLLTDSEGSFGIINCSDISAPSAVEAQKAKGIVKGGSAVIIEDDGLLQATLFKLENGSDTPISQISQVGAYSASLSQNEKDSLELYGANSIAVLGDTGDSRSGCAFSYKYFDGVSVVSVCAVFGENNSETKLFDDKTGFNAIFAHNGKIIAVSSGGAEVVLQ